MDKNGAQRPLDGDDEPISETWSWDTAYPPPASPSPSSHDDDDSDARDPDNGQPSNKEEEEEKEEEKEEDVEINEAQMKRAARDLGVTVEKLVRLASKENRATQRGNKKQ